MTRVRTIPAKLGWHHAGSHPPCRVAKGLLDEFVVLAALLVGDLVRICASYQTISGTQNRDGVFHLFRWIDRDWPIGTQAGEGLDSAELETPARRARKNSTPRQASPASPVSNAVLPFIHPIHSFAPYILFVGQ